MKRNLFIVCAVFCVWAGAGYCAESLPEYWPTWRGPNMSGVSTTAVPPLTWSQTDHIVWTVDVPGDTSNSTPIIWKDKLYFQIAEPVSTEQEAAEAVAEPAEQAAPRRSNRRMTDTVHRFSVVCLDRLTGKLLWQTPVKEAVPHEGHHADSGFASFSPTTDGRFIYASFGSQGVYCLDMDGKVQWQQDLGKMRIRAGFGEGSSPLLVEDRLIVLMDHEDQSKITALDRRTGKIVWQKERDEATAWTTPIAIPSGREQMQVIVNGSNRVRCYNFDNGDVIWECGGQTQNVVPSPVTGFGMVFCTSGFRGSALLAITLGRTGDLTDTDAVVWRVNEGTPYVPSPLLVGEKLYVLAGNNAVLSCYNAKTGKPYYTQQTIEGLRGVYASPIAAGGRVYVVGRNGVTAVLNNESDSYEVLATNRLDDVVDCSLAAVDNMLYVKGKKSLYCISEPPQKADEQGM